GFGLSVVAEDVDGNVNPSFAGNTTLALAANPGGSTLRGSTVAAFAGGVASFSSLTLNVAASGYMLDAVSGALMAASALFSVIPGAVTQLAIVSAPGSVAAGVGFGLSVVAEDVDGNVNPSFAGNTTLALAANPGGSTLQGSTIAAFVGGVASFSSLTLN